MFDMAEEGNLVSIDISDSTVIINRGNVTTDRTYHSVEFLHYIYLNLGRYKNALASLDALQPLIPLDPYWLVQYTFLYVRHLVETQNYGNSHDLSLVLNCSDFEDFCSQQGNYLWTMQANAAVLLVRGLGAAIHKDFVFANQMVDMLRNYSYNLVKSLPTLSVSISAMSNQVMAMIELYQNNPDQASIYAQKAFELEDSIQPPAYGPPIDPVKPSAELYGEVLLAIGNYSGAIDAFDSSFFYFPNRTLSIVGLARSYSKLGIISKACFNYNILLSQWKKCDIDQPFFVEAERYVTDECENSTL